MSPGAAALTLSANANLDVDELQQVLIDAAILTDPAYPEWPNYGYGYGWWTPGGYKQPRTICSDLDAAGRQRSRCRRGSPRHIPAH